MRGGISIHAAIARVSTDRKEEEILLRCKSFHTLDRWLAAHNWRVDKPLSQGIYSLKGRKSRGVFLLIRLY
jgi:hypothetical protein